MKTIASNLKQIRVVSDTGKAVTAGIGAAKGAIYSWWGGLRQEKTPSPGGGEDGVEEVASEATDDNCHKQE